jgi:DNA replication protein DnaC
MEALIDGLSESVPQAESEYIGEDGLLHCSACHKRTERMAVIPELGINKKVRCICDCKKAEMNAFEERMKREELERQKMICFSETNMQNWNFKNDDRKNPKLSDAMLNYVNNFTEFKKDGKGLLLYGTVGTGKTYYAACIANRLIDQGYAVLMTNFARLTNQIQGMFEGKQKYIDSLNRYQLLIIDDLGTERKSEFMQEMVFNIVDARYRSGLPFIITTNLTAEEIKKPQDVGYSRIYDRILERCFPVEVSGASRRRQNVKDSFFDVKEKLGL